MELREWLIILGLVLVTAIVLDGVRRYQRQRGVPRLDQMGAESASDSTLFSTAGSHAADSGTASSAERSDNIPDTAVDWELPNGGARVVRPAQYDDVAAKPKLERQEHPGPSRVLSEFRQRQQTPAEDATRSSAQASAVGQLQPSRSASAVSTPTQSIMSTQSASEMDNVDCVDNVDTRSSVAVGANASDVDSESSGTDQVSASQQHGSQDQNEDKKSSRVLEAAPEKISALDEPSGRREPELTLPGDDETAAQPTDHMADERHEPLHAEPQDHMAHEYDEEDYRLVDLEGMGDSFKEGSRRMGTSVHRFGTSLHRSMSERRQQKRVERKQRQAEKEEKARIRAKQQAEEKQRQRKQAEEQAAKDAARREYEAQAQQQREASKAEHEAALSASLQAEYESTYADGADTNQQSVSATASFEDEVVSHPVLQKALDSAVEAEHAKDALSGAGEVIIISVMSRDEAGFSGPTLLNLMLACGLRYSTDMGIFHRFETEAADSNLQFSMVNAVKPGTFPVPQLEDFSTPGITLLMPLPGADDTSAAFEAMVETAMVIVRHLGGELKDEHQSVMTAQTVEFARQRVQEFERRYRLRRYRVN